MGVGVALGVAVGAAFGVALDDMVVGLALGMAMGIGFGAVREGGARSHEEAVAAVGAGAAEVAEVDDAVLDENSTDLPPAGGE